MGRWGGVAPPNGPSTSTVRPIATRAATTLESAMLRPLSTRIEKVIMDDAAPAEPTDMPEQSFSTATLWLLTLGGGLLAALLLRLRQGVDPDLWLHLRLGEQLRTGERFQRVPDPLVVLADQPYSPTQWLSEVVMSVVHELTGVAGIHVLRALAVVALLTFLQLTAAVYTT